MLLYEPFFSSQLTNLRLFLFISATFALAKVLTFIPADDHRMWTDELFYVLCLHMPRHWDGSVTEQHWCTLLFQMLNWEKMNVPTGFWSLWRD